MFQHQKTNKLLISAFHFVHPNCNCHYTMQHLKSNTNSVFSHAAFKISLLFSETAEKIRISDLQSCCSFQYVNVDKSHLGNVKNSVIDMVLYWNLWCITKPSLLWQFHNREGDEKQRETVAGDSGIGISAGSITLAPQHEIYFPKQSGS